MFDRGVRRNRVRRAITTLLAAAVVALASPSPGAAATPIWPGAAATPIWPGAPAPTVSAAAADPAGGRGPTLTEAVSRSLQSRLTALRKKYAIPGISVAIIFPDGSTWVDAVGFADVEAKVPVVPDTAFAIASVSKTFTAALVMRLVEDGLVALDAPVGRYLPDLGLDDRITVRQLLDHTSGLRDYFLHPRIDRALLTDRARRWDEAGSLGYVGKPYFDPGQEWRYSNTNYLILGMLAERVGGAPLAEMLRARFLEPLGLSNTWYQPSEAPRGPVAHGYRFASASTEARAIDLSDGTAIVPFTSVVTAAAGAGGLASSAGDVARWARALYAGSALGESTVAAMIGDVVRTAPYRPRVPYGLGVQAADVSGRPALGHSGRFLGFRSVVRHLPEDGTTIAVLTNQSRTDPAIIARAMLKIALRSAPDCACAAVR